MRTTTFIGNTIERRGRRLVKTDGKERLYFLLKDDGVPLGMKVRVEVKDKDLELREEDPFVNIYCNVVEVLGNASDPDLALKSLIESYELDRAFSDEAIEMADNLALAYDENMINEEIANGRRDLRDLNTFTIDGLDAKDLDDAISIECLDDGKVRLWVHIADVSHFVEEGSSLDKEALDRGNSTYLPGQVFPMLPSKLSNGICSLNPDSDRLCLSVAIVYDRNYKVVSSKIFETVIRSDLRADYKGIREIFSKYKEAELLPYQIDEFKDELPEKYAKLADELLACRKLSFALRDKRLKQGSLDFSFTESKVIFDEDGKIVDIEPRSQTWSEEMIEEFMIAANEVVASHAKIKKIPILYRTHDEPEQELLLSFAPLARTQGISLTIPEHPSPKLISEWIEKIKGLEVSEMLLTLLLRSLAKARYDAEALGHFGLALKDYCHFTSPIRRYSDLFTHRAIKNHIAGQSNRNLKRIAQRVADHISKTEVNSQYAERDAVKICMAEFMLDKIGEKYVGKISGFCSRGAFVKLENTVEGLAPFEQLGDFFEYDEKSLVARGRNSRRVLKIGDEVLVKVDGASVASATVDFSFIKEQLPGEKYFGKKGAFDHLFKGAAETHLRRRFRKSGFDTADNEDVLVVEALRPKSEFYNTDTNKTGVEDDFELRDILEDDGYKLGSKKLTSKRRPFNRRNDDEIFYYGGERESGKYRESYRRQRDDDFLSKSFDTDSSYEFKKSVLDGDRVQKAKSFRSKSAEDKLFKSQKNGRSSTYGKLNKGSDKKYKRKDKFKGKNSEQVFEQNQDSSFIFDKSKRSRKNGLKSKSFRDTKYSQNKPKQKGKRVSASGSGKGNGKGRARSKRIGR